MEFEWDENKKLANQAKHGVSFEEAGEVFLDPDRLTKFDHSHSRQEARFFCYGKTAAGKILTVRFTTRNNKIRIIGAGEWRFGREVYEQENKKNQ